MHAHNTLFFFSLSARHFIINSQRSQSEEDHTAILCNLERIHEASQNSCHPYL